MRIVITGATGFLGAHVINALSELNHEVVGTIRHLDKLRNHPILSEKAIKSTTWIVADISDIFALEAAFYNATCVIHTAAVVSFDPKQLRNMFATNVDGTANVVNACLNANVRRLIHISSVAALGRNSSTQNTVDETATFATHKENTNYAISKFQAEMEAWRGAEEGLEVSVVNPSIILGQGDWNTGSCKLIKVAADGLLFYPPGGSGFVDVLDVSRAIILLAESENHGLKYILNGVNISYRSLFTKIAILANKPSPRLKLPQVLGEIGWRLNYIYALITNSEKIITKETIRNSFKIYAYNTSKIEKEMNFKFTPFDESLKNIMISYRGFFVLH